MIRIRVNGTPAPQGSKRHVGGGRMVESSRAVGPWREAVRAEAAAVLHSLAPGREWARENIWPHTPVSVNVVFMMRRPASHLATGKAARAKPGLLKPSAPTYPTTRPDTDKLARAVLDGLVEGGVMADDAQVVTLTARKVYAAAGQAPGVLIEVEAL